MLGLAVTSLAGLPLGWAIAGHATSPGLTLGLGIAVAAISLAQAILITRWRDRETGMLVGILVSAGWTTMCCLTVPRLVLSAMAAVAAILIYALAEVSNRSEVGGRAWASQAFCVAAAMACLLGGPTLLVSVAAVCLGTVLGNGNSRGLRFFGSPFGLFFLVGVAIGSTSIMVTVPSYPGSGSNVANPLLSQWSHYVGLAMGIAVTWSMVRSGHGASPLGRLLISWLLGPLIVATVGLIPGNWAVAITLPAWAAIAGMALLDLRRRFRSRRLLAYLISLQTRCRPT